MSRNNNRIALNFIEITPKNFDITFYWKKLATIPKQEQKNYYKLNFKDNDNVGNPEKAAIIFEEKEGFKKQIVTSAFNIDLTKRFLFEVLIHKTKENGVEIYPTNRDKYRRLYLPIKKEIEGVEAIWVEPYFLKQTNSYGILIDFKFWVDPIYQESIKGSVNKRILQLSGTLDNKGLANKAFYQFKFDKLKIFFNKFLPKLKELNFNSTKFSIADVLTELEEFSLDIKTYQFFDERENNSPYFGLQKNSPYQRPEKNTKFLFVFKDNDRSFAIQLWNGLTGKAYSSTFSGIEKMFKIPFNNDCIKGRKVDSFSKEVLSEIVDEIISEREKGSNVLPIILTKSRLSDADEKIYFTIKHTFTKENIPCQVVTKDLILNTSSLKYSLSNIALQIFAKAGGKPWKVKPAIKECLIIGIGNRNKEIFIKDNDGEEKRKIEKFLTYSVLTDSSGLFKEIQILSETDNEDEYYRNLVTRLNSIIQQAVKEGVNDIVIHSPFRISKDKVWDIIFKNLPESLTLSILIINDTHKFFGFDLSKNALVPYESSFINLSKHEALVWFEGLQYNNAAFAKRIGSPVYINFWYSNNNKLQNDDSYRKNLLQDCINLSGANWRGFKAKQLPVSIYYCQRIAEFLKKFDDYNLEQIEFENFKPWFL